MNHSNERKTDGEGADDCCGGKKQTGTQQSAKTILSKLKNNLGQVLLVLLGLVIAVNSIVMFFFTTTVNAKLGEAVELVEPQTGEVILVLPENCPNCGNLSAEKSALLAENIVPSDDKVLFANSEEGKALVDAFALRSLPALIFRSEEKIKDHLAASFGSDAWRVEERAVVWEKKQPPYVDVASKNIAGLVDVVYITDKSCQKCYNVVEVQRPILQRFGVAMRSEKTVDMSSEEGRRLIATYGISSVPTMILSSEAESYPVLKSVWGQVGTVEEDKTHVFRDLGALGMTYKDMQTGRIVEPEQS
jgi:hypothetical protein